MDCKGKGTNQRGAGPDDVGVMDQSWAREVGGFGLLWSWIGMWLVVGIR